MAMTNSQIRIAGPVGSQSEGNYCCPECLIANYRLQGHEFCNPNAWRQYWGDPVRGD